MYLYGLFQFYGQQVEKPVEVIYAQKEISQHFLLHQIGQRSAIPLYTHSLSLDLNAIKHEALESIA